MASLSWLSLLVLASRVTWAAPSPQDDEDPFANFPICLSYGMDFQDGGSYFQNVKSNDSFSFVSQFEHCQRDVANNILIDPDNNQYLCSNTSLTPDDTNQLSNCPIKKSQLTSGDWTIVLMSNNGHARPIAYQRDFSLSVGPQSTSTFTPTATITVLSVPVINATSTVFDTLTTSLNPSTITRASRTIRPTKTIVPPRVTSTATSTLFTLRVHSIKVDIEQTTVTRTASCRYPRRPSTCDPSATVTPTVGAFAYRGFSNKVRRDIDDNNARWLEERRVRLQERAPDPQPLVVNETRTDKFISVTTTSVGPTSTATILTTSLFTATITPAPITVISGQTVVPVVTVTATPRTRTVKRFTWATTTVVKTSTYVYTVRSTTTPAAVKSACKSAGGILW